MNRVECNGPKCLVCDAIGRPDTILIIAIDANTQKPIQLSLPRKKAIELGLLKPETTVLDDLIEAVDRA